MNKAPEYSTKLRERAKKDNLVLICFDVDGRPSKIGGRATLRFAIERADAERLLAEVVALYSAWCKKGGE